MQRSPKSFKSFSNLRKDERPAFLSLDGCMNDPVFLDQANPATCTSRSRLLDTPWPGEEFKHKAQQSQSDFPKQGNIEIKNKIKDVQAKPLNFVKKQLDANEKRVEINQARHKIRPDLASSSEICNEHAKKSENYYNEHLHKTFQAIKFIRNLPPVDLLQLKQKRVNLPKKAGYRLKKTLIFDLDETLIHCVKENMDPDVILPIKFDNEETMAVGFNIRPYAKEVLLEASKYFEVVIFTAAQKTYADAILDYLDPQNDLIHHRLYRENCLLIENAYIKDLRIFSNRRIQDLVIVDNSAYSFGYHLDNGIPIVSWHDDPCDKELFNLIHYLKMLAKCEDVRVLNRQYFKLRTFYEDYIQEFSRKGNSPTPAGKNSRIFQ